MCEYKNKINSLNKNDKETHFQKDRRATTLELASSNYIGIKE
jgi:hypothetical protein